MAGHWHVLAWEVVALAAASSPVASRSRMSRTCVRVGPPATGPKAAGRPSVGRPSYPSRIRVENGDTGRHRPGGLVAPGNEPGATSGGARGGRRGLGAVLRAGSKIAERNGACREHVPRFLITRFSFEFILEASLTCHGPLYQLYEPCHVATCLFDPALRLSVACRPGCDLAANVTVAGLSAS